MKSWLAALLLALLSHAAAQLPLSGKKFVLDPGHGGTDPGAVGIDGGAYPNEEDFVLDVVQQTRTKLEAAGATVLLTRDSDTTVSLTARRDLANAEDPDAFLSVHCNSFSDPAAHGTETFWWTSGNAADQSLATAMQNRQLQAFGLTNRGVKQANFTVITATPPAALAEMMFISNQAEFDLMNTPAVRTAAADAFYRGMGDFLGIDLNAPIVVDHPDSVLLAPGATANFAAVVSGTVTSYRWQKDGVNLTNGGKISGATSPNLTITNVQLSDAGFYRLVVTGASVVSSNAAQLAISSTPAPPGTGSGLRGTYYDNLDFTALRRARLDPTVNFAWGEGSPSSTMQPDTFSVRWTGQVQPRYSQTYRFYVRSDDGVRLWINNVLLIDQWVDQSLQEHSAVITLTAGQKYDLRLDYYERSGAAQVEFSWSSPSQLKEIVPTSRLYRPPPVVIPPGTLQIVEGSPWQATVTASAFDPILSSQPWADFEGLADGTSDSVLFRKPQFSGTTNAFIDAAKTRETSVVAALPTGNSSTRALRVQWSWAPAVTNPWLRLTTLNPATLPNPVVDFRKALRFDVWSEHTLKFALGLRETNSPGPVATDGGSTGTIEFAGATDVSNLRPVPVRTLVPDVWTTMEFDLPAEPIRPFTGNGVLESTTGFGVLEHLAVVPGSASVDHIVYLDNFVVVEKNFLTYTILSGPAGLQINPLTGVLSWSPQAAHFGGLHPVSIQMADAGSPPITSTADFTIRAVPLPRVTHYSRNGNQFSFSWTSAPGAIYDIESTTQLSGPWIPVQQITASGNTATYTGTAVAPRSFFRAKLR